MLKKPSGFWLYADSFSDLKTSSLSVKDQGVLAAIASQGFYADDENAMNVLESQNKQNSGLVQARKTGSSSNSLIEGNNPSLQKTQDGIVEQSYRAKSNDNTTGYANMNSYGSAYPSTYQRDYESDTLKIQYGHNDLDQKQLSKNSYQKTQAQLKEEKQIIANAFKGKNNDYTKNPPVIYYVEAERTIASESSNTNNKIFLWSAILVIVTIFALHKFMQNK